MEKLSKWCEKAIAPVAIALLLLMSVSVIQQIATRAVTLHTMMELRDSARALEKQRADLIKGSRLT